MRCRRAIRTVLVFVLLGAVATVLSSWAIHAVQFWRLHQGSRTAYGWTRVELEASPLWRGSESATIRAFGPWRVLPDDPRWHDPTDQRIFPPIHRRRAGWHVESQVFSTSKSDELDQFPSREAMCIFDTGFPSRSMRCGSYVGRFFDHGLIYHDTHTDGSSWHGGLQLSPWTPGALPPTVLSNGRIAPLDRIALPLLPLWPGFLLNTLFYALLLFIAWRTPIFVRRTLRRRRGRCVGCGYDQQGLDPHAACPECGAGDVHARQTVHERPA